jgi:CheY-like chemotaxis protein
VLDLNELIEEVTQMLSSAMGEDVEVLTNYAPDLGNVHADPAQITQVLMNLALNARDAMPEGGVLTIETENVELDRNYTTAHRGVTPGPYVMTAISDNGCGMDTATQERIFDPFFTTKPTGRGSGLGLPTAYGIIKQHGGNIWVYSEPGEGSTFKFYLPRTESRVRRRSEDSGRDTAAGGEESILLVEDEESVRKLATRVLERKGYSIVSAATPKEAENLFHRHGGDFALLLTDVVLPGRSGGELYDRLRTSASTLRVLYMSGYTDSVVVQRGKISEDAPFLRKPFSADELAQKVRDLLDE